MTNREIVIAVLKARSCMTAADVASYARRRMNEIISPSQAAGSLRVMYREGLVGKSPNVEGKMVYWLTKGV